MAAQPVAWRWALGTGNNGVWLGRAEAGLFLKLRGEGGRWEDPMFSSDFGVIPFIPPSWGGANATPATSRTDTGANVSVGAGEVRVLAFSGPRHLSATPQRFLKASGAHRSGERRLPFSRINQPFGCSVEPK